MTTRSLGSFCSDCIGRAFLPPLGRAREARREARDLGRYCSCRAYLAGSSGGQHRGPVRPPLARRTPVSPPRRLAAPSATRAGAGRLLAVLPRPFEGAQVLNQSRNLAARAGRWSAQHRKTAILGWILFVVLATVVGGRVGLNDDRRVGGGQRRVQARRHDRRRPPGFPEQAGEQVLIQGKGSIKSGDPQVTAAVKDVVQPPRGDPGHHRDREPARTRPTASTPSPRTAARSS